MGNKLMLENVDAYEIIAPTDERNKGSFGIYKNVLLANKDAENCGWYGSSGNVNMLNNIYSDGENIYKLIKLDGFKDEQHKIKEELTESIKSKLSEDELSFLKNNVIE